MSINGDTMGNRDEIIRRLYNTYNFIEKDISKFKEIPCLNDVKDFADGAKKLSHCVAQEIAKDGFITTFKNAAQTSGIDKALVIFYLVSEETGYEIKDEDVIEIANIEEYKKFYDAFLKHYFIKNANDLDNRDITNTLQKRVFMARLNSDEMKKHNKNESKKQRQSNRKSIYQDIPYSREEIDEVISTLSDEDTIEERRVDENMSNKYNIVVYKKINADHSLIDKIISELPEKEQKLIERKGRISLGIFDKLLTPEEEERFNSIIKKIIYIIDPKAKIVESKEEKKEKVKIEKQKKEKSKSSKKRGKKPVSIYKLIPANKSLVDQYLNEKLDAERLKIVNKREKLIREGRYDDIPKNYKTIIQGIVIPARKRIMYLEEEINKLRKRKESKQQNKKGGTRKKLEDFLPSYSKEELDKLLEQIPEDDREILQARREGKELTKPDLERYYRVIHKLEKGIIPTPRKRRIKEELIIIETQEGKGTHPERSIFTLIPIDRDILNQYIEEHLEEDEKNIIRTRERIINENSSERITQRAVDKFARIIQKIREALIPEENMEEVNKEMRKGVRTSIYENKKMEFFSKEEIDAEIANLPAEEKELIEKSENGEKLTVQERGRVRYITNKIENILYQKKIQSEKTPISREQLLEELKQTEEAVKIPSVLPTKEIIKEKPRVVPVKEDNDDVNLANYYKKLLAVAIKDRQIIEEVDLMDITMTCLRYGIGETTQKMDVETIAKFFNNTPSEVEMVTSNVLKKLYDVIVSDIENTNNNSVKLYVKVDVKKED